MIPSPSTRDRASRRGYFRRTASVAAAGLALLAGFSAARAAEPPIADLTRLPLERLLALEVVSASKFPQKVTEAPASVTVITAADIRDYGYRSLADILRSVRGLHVSYDRNYSYLGVRGFSRPADYNSRVLLLIDGYRANDNIYDQAGIGSEFPIDVDLIERVEFVPGPGSSIYGSNAFFGVINVVTRRGASLDGFEAAGAAGSFRSRAGRASFGRRLANGAELLVSATAARSRGQDLFYPEFVPLGVADGFARGLDFDRQEQVFAKLSYAGWTLQAVHGERTKGIPTASFGTAPGVAGTQTLDRASYLDLRHARGLGGGRELTGRIYYGRYDYEGDYVYDLPPLTRNKDLARGAWWGAEAKLLDAGIAGHKLIFGAEYQRDLRQQQVNYDEQPRVSYLDDACSGNRVGLYVQDEIGLREDLTLNAGLRYDHHARFGGIFNPRLGLIHRLPSQTFVKLLYGQAYRAPNAFELYYSFPGAGGQKPNPDLRPERIATYELAVERYYTDRLRLGASIFHYAVKDLINATTDPADGLLVFRNLDRARATGAGIEAERAWRGGARLRASYSLQQVEDATGARLTNSPRHLAKLNWAAPLPLGRLRAGLELQYTGARRTLAGETGGYWLANLNLGAAELARGLDAALTLYNLFDKRYADPAGGEHLQDAIPQDGRSLRLKLVYRY